MDPILSAIKKAVELTHQLPLDLEILWN